MLFVERPVEHKSLRTTTKRWLIVIAAYYAIVILKALLWATRHGGFEAHNMNELIGITLRTTTVDGAILFALTAAFLW